MWLAVMAISINQCGLSVCLVTVSESLKAKIMASIRKAWQLMAANPERKA